MEEESEHITAVLPEFSSKMSKGRILLIVFVAACVAAATVGIIQRTSENNKWHAWLISQQKADAAVAATAWIPDGYTAFSENPDIAQDSSADPACTSSADAGGKFCWTYQIATKRDCSKVIATLDLKNGTKTVATVTGEVADVQSSTPTFLEVDSGPQNDAVVTSNTVGHLIAIECY